MFHKVINYGFVPHCPHSPYISYGDSTDPDPQLYHVILSCKSAIAFQTLTWSGPKL